MHINYHRLNLHAVISTIMYSDYYFIGAGHSQTSQNVTLKFFELTIAVHIKNRITTTKKCILHCMVTKTYTYNYSYCT